MATRTVEVSEALYREAEAIAASSGCSLSRLFEDALREAFARAKSPNATEPSRAPVFDGGGAQPGIDLSDSSMHPEFTEKPFRLITYGTGGPAPGVDLDDSSALLEWVGANRPDANA